jgi:hypothetical protein
VNLPKGWLNEFTRFAVERISPSDNTLHAKYTQSSMCHCLGHEDWNPAPREAHATILCTGWGMVVKATPGNLQMTLPSVCIMYTVCMCPYKLRSIQAATVTPLPMAYLSNCLVRLCRTGLPFRCTMTLRVICTSGRSADYPYCPERQRRSGNRIGKQLEG